MRTKLRKNRGFKNKKSGNQKIYLLGKTHCSRDRQGRVSVRRLGLVYLKKEPQRKKDNALNCIILFKFPYKLRITPASRTSSGTKMAILVLLPIPNQEKLL
ncbi:hypothetical protein AEL95_01060 [Lactobacillus crispatus]|uniref:Uncharacterized protein n=1 Tax=Lactobacillus crispatus TaxID=47770 RepID=A0A120DIZ3_9LACO|nr:hypothetical protein AEL95_01060 [Lactobacillus crispatus]